MRALLLAAFIACAPAQQGKGAGAWVSAFDPSGDNAYASWLAQGNFPYQHSYMLNAPDDDDDVAVAMHWSIDKKENLLRMAVAAEATGWLGFGLAEVGGMPGADIVVFTASDSSLTDLYATAYEQPHEDASQDWTLVNSSTEGGFIIWEATRKLDTGDLKDRALLDDSQREITPTKIIAAYGDSDDLAFHGKNRFKGLVRFYGNVGDVTEQFLHDMAAEGKMWKEFKAPSTNIIPSKSTTYARFCMTASEMGFTDKVHVIGFLPIIQNPKLVHHADIYASESEDLSCSSKEFRNKIFFNWAIGNPPFALPSAAGYPVGGVDGLKSFMLVIHYNNPEGKQGVQDSSGHRIYFAEQLRQHDAALLSIGDPNIALIGKQLQAGLTRHIFDCASSCTQNLFEADEVTVFYERLHSHATGARISNQVIRSGDVIHEGAVDYFDYTQEGSLNVQQPSFVMQRGDAIRTTFYYNTTGHTAFGLASENEMSMAWFGYYPKQPILGCAYSRHTKKRSHKTCTASYNWTSIEEADLGRAFELNPDLLASAMISSTLEHSESPSLSLLALVTIMLFMSIPLIASRIYNRKRVHHDAKPSPEETADLMLRGL